MQVHGELLTPEDREQTKAHFCKNDGKKWDLHEMSLYVQSGYDAADSDPEAKETIQQGMLRVRQGHEHG